MFEDTRYLKHIFEKDEKFVKSLAEPPTKDDDETGKTRSEGDNELPIIEMVEKDYHQVLSVFIDLKAKIEVFCKSKLNESLLQVAFRKKYPNTIKVLLS